MEMGDTDKVYKNLADCRQHGIRVLPPDVNSSRADFTVCDEGIRFGLGAVKGAGGKAVDVIVQARRDGPFKSLGDFCLRVMSQQVNKRIVEGLIKAGAFDSIERSRTRLLAGLDAAMAWAVRVNEDRAAGQMGLFGGASGSSQPEPELPAVPDWDEAKRLEAEHEVVGFYISGHPLERHAGDLEFLAVKGTASLEPELDQSTVRLAGVTNTVRRKNSRKGDRYATFNLEDQEGIIEVIAWPKVYAQYESAIVGREPVFITGRLEMAEGFRTANADDGAFAMKPQIIAEEIIALSEKRRKTARGVDLTVAGGSLGDNDMERLKATLQRHPGGCRPFLKVLRAGETETLIELPKELGIDPTDRFLADIEDILGPGAAVLR
jgi:DNA polymerase-3 subunit alpha